MSELVSEVIKEYKKIVDLEQEKRKGIDIFSSSMPHTAYTIKCLLEITEREARVLSGTFFEPFYDDLQKTIYNTLERGVHFRIITIYPGLEDIEESLKNKYENFDFISLKVSPLKKEAHQIHHFSVYDGDKWRIEEPHAPKLDKGSIVRATTCFNDPRTGKDLRQTFDHIWDSVLEKRKSKS